MDTIDFKIDNDGIATLTIDVKGRPMNVMTPEFLQDLAEAAKRVADDDKVKAAVITSGKDSFMAGADLVGLVDTFDERTDAAEVYGWCRELNQLLRGIETCGKPFAAAINGTALGGGLEICLACHYRVAADNPKSVLGLPEVQVGLLPGGGGTQRLPRLIGIEPALQLITQGKHLTPAEALKAGIVHEVVAPGQEIAAAKAWLLKPGDAVQPWDAKGFKVPGGAGLMHPAAVQTFVVGTALLQKMTNHNYPAPIAIMSAVYEGTVLPMDKALDIESKYFTKMLMNPVSRNMSRTLFVNKGAADKLVRRPADPPKQKVQKLGVLGAGMMGAGIAFVSAKAGMQVVLLDTSKEKAEFGKDYSRGLLQKRVEKGRSTANESEEILKRIVTTDDYAKLSGCELVIEAVFEDRRIKAEVTAKAEAVIGSDAIFASNTSTLPITGLAKASTRPKQFVGIHFFSPVDKMPLVEVIVGEETGETAVAQALDYIQQIRKTPIVVNDSRGFYTSRVFGVYCREGMIMLSEGVNPALIENVAKHAGMPVGPLAVTDEVSLELSYHVMSQTKKDLGDAYITSPSDAVLIRMVDELDRRGKRFGKGFYDYPEGGKKRLWPGLREHYPHAKEQPTADEVRTRLLYAQAIETVRCLDEGVVTHPADADIGSVFGWGFPPYTGGTLSFIETEGLAAFVSEADRLAAEHGDRFAVPDKLRKMARKGETFYGLARKREQRAAA
ncbi:MAG: 3-hydroxyacyl-CoA dehydrogenase NAD-binding domain-containing protein [Gammaproteobacteria bacterium]|nr:3-hydroxyacyl-CoA dehydrogenase NAD-binding domain-containing protein [Gammaproteobacteria bacterium]MDH4314620.1 3-hydroxyacyl-CoA dehydrogenase NAD-binding domain-containing protein [Gammaproteobacteria bacterium]MDH5212856.1 3-hydroxyacyl-CoA dehydrogenase NAD-binding domain-containing protein [Gammaproteobacteria bacterium]